MVKNSDKYIKMPRFVCGAVMVLLLLSSAVSWAKNYDPMRPQVVVAQASTSDGSDVTTQDLRLQAILVAAGRRVAVVNGETLKVGDMIGAYKLHSISSTYVKLRAANGKIAGEKKLQLHPNIVIRKQVNGAN